MTPTPEMWAALNTLGLFGLAALAAWGKWRDTRNRKADEKARAATVEAIEEVKTIVNGPLTHQITMNKDLAAANAALTAKVAELTGSPLAIQAAAVSEIKAVEAAAVDKDRQLGHVEPKAK